MTSTPVTKLPTMITNVTKTNAAANAIGTFGSSFSQVMSRAEGAKPSEDGVKPVQKKTAAESQDTFAKQLTNEKPVNAEDNAVNDKAVQETQTAQETQPAKDAETAKEEVTDAAKNVLKETAEELNVSEEEVLSAMEVLGMSLLDLLNPDNMAELVLQISDEPDMLSLLTDGELYSSVQTLQETVNTENLALQETLSMDAEQTAEFIDELKRLETGGQPEEAGQNSPVMETAQEAPVIEFVKEEAPDEEADSSLKALQQSVSDKTEAPMENTLRTAAAPDNTQEREAQNQGGEKGKNTSQPQSFSMQQPVNTNAAPDAVFAEQSFTPFASAETKQIMNQILDYMRVNVKPDVSEMEMHLHPASLGNVRILLAAKDGILTAQFRAESEMVKSALEAQMIQLKDSLDEKGVKVEAIEVTVESHAFERNLEQGSQGNNGNPQEPKKRSARRINLSGLNGADNIADDFLTEGLEEADRLTAEMMAQAGNTVDFTA